LGISVTIRAMPSNLDAGCLGFSKASSFGVFILIFVCPNESIIDKCDWLFMISLWSCIFVKADTVTTVPLIWIGEKP